MKPDRPTKLPKRSEPWHRAVYGTMYYLLVDETTAACVAAGCVTASLQMQAKQMCDFLKEPK